MLEREFVGRNMAEPDARKKLLGYGEHLAASAPRHVPFQLPVREAAATDAGAARVWRQMLEERVVA